MAKSKAELAGRMLGRALIEMIYLVYKKNVMNDFVNGLLESIDDAAKKLNIPRKMPKKQGKRS